LLIRLEVEEFLYREAALLDDRKVRGVGGNLFTEDTHYFMPIRRNPRATGAGAGVHEARGDGLLRRPEVSILQARVVKLTSGTAVGRRTRRRGPRRLITNVLVHEDRGDELEVRVQLHLVPHAG